MPALPPLGKSGEAQEGHLRLFAQQQEQPQLFRAPSRTARRVPLLARNTYSHGVGGRRREQRKGAWALRASPSSNLSLPTRAWAPRLLLLLLLAAREGHLLVGGAFNSTEELRKEACRAQLNSTAGVGSAAAGGHPAALCKRDSDGDPQPLQKVGDQRVMRLQKPGQDRASGKRRLPPAVRQIWTPGAQRARPRPLGCEWQSSACLPSASYNATAKPKPDSRELDWTCSSTFGLVAMPGAAETKAFGRGEAWKLWQRPSVLYS